MSGSGATPIAEVFQTMSHLAVVPIFVNAGAAILPAVIGGATQFVAALFRPREMVALVRRRPWVPAVALAVLGAAGAGIWWVAAAPTAPPKAEAKAAEGPPPIDWGDTGRRIVAERKAVAERSPTGLETLWTFGAPRKDEDGEWGLTTWFLATPHVRGGVVYTTTALASVGGQSGAVLAIDARSGRQLWRTGSPAPDQPNFKPIYSSPTLTDDGRWVVVGQGLHLDAGCSLLCLDAATGAVRWQVPTPLHLESSPAVRGDLAVIGAGAIEDAVTRRPTGDPGFVLAVRVSTGRTIWRYPLADPESSPAIADDGTVYVGSGFNGSAVVALRGEPDAELAGRDRLIWRVAAPHPVLGDVLIAGDLVIAGTSNSDMVNLAPVPGGGVIAVDRRSGTTAWRWDAGDSVLGGVAVANGRVYVPLQAGDVAALDAATGTLLWRKRIATGTAIKARPAVTATHLYVTTADGRLHVIDAADGRVLESVLLSHPEVPVKDFLALSGPVVVNGRVYVGSETGGLKCLVGTK